MVSAIGNSTTAATAGGSTDGAITKFAQDFDDFLTLMIAQLNNQDPLDPLESSEFTDQIVQFTGVEQSINTNTKLDTLISTVSNDQGVNLVNYTGKNVETIGNLVTLPASTQNGEEVVQGQLSFAYELDEPAENVFITIKDLAGATVFTGDGPNKAGRNSVTWDGIKNDGDYLNGGNFQVIVTTADANNDVTTVDTYVSGTVQGVNFDGDDPTLIVNGEIIPFDAIRFVGDA